MSLDLPVLFRQGFFSPSAYPVEVWDGEIDPARSKRRYEIVGPGEVPLWGARRVKNLWPTADFLSAGTLVNALSFVRDGESVALTSSGGFYYRRVTVPFVYGQRFAARVQLAAEAPCAMGLRFTTTAGGPGQSVSRVVNLTPDPVWVSLIHAFPSSATALEIGIDARSSVVGSGATGLNIPIRLLRAQIEHAPTQAVPSEYVDPTVDHGAGVAGVRWYRTKLANSVTAAGFLVDGVGQPIPDIDGLRPWPAYTMHARNTALQVSTHWGCERSSLQVSSLNGPFLGLPVMNLLEFDPSTVTHHRFSQNIYTSTGSQAWAAAIVKAEGRPRIWIQLYNGVDFFRAQVVFNLLSRTVAAISIGDGAIRDLGDGWCLCFVRTISPALGAHYGAYFTLDDGSTTAYTASDGLLGARFAWAGGGNGLVPYLIATEGAPVSVLGDDNQIPTSTPASGRWSAFIEYTVPSPDFGFNASSYTASYPRLLGGPAGSVGHRAWEGQGLYLQDAVGQGLVTSGAPVFLNGVNRAVIVVNPPITRVWLNGQLAAEGSFTIARPLDRIGYAPSGAYGLHGVRAYQIWPDFAMPGPMADVLTASRAA